MHSYSELSDHNDCTPDTEYAVYSYSSAPSEKKGQVWRQHGVSNNEQEALWIAEQLKACERIERIEIRLQGRNPKTKMACDQKIKVIDRTEGRLFAKLRALLPL